MDKLREAKLVDAISQLKLIEDDLDVLIGEDVVKQSLMSNAKNYVNMAIRETRETLCQLRGE
jgi:hypothetical protein